MIKLLKDILNVIIISIKSSLGPDVLTIPERLGNSMMFSNSTIITHDRLSTIIKVNLLGTEVPYNFMSVIDGEIARYGLDCIMDIHFKLQKYDYNDKARKDININIQGWERISKQEEGKSKHDAEWGLTSAQTLLSTTSFNCSMYIKLYAKDGMTLRRAVDVVKQCMSKSGSLCFSGTYSLQEMLEEISISSLKAPEGQQFPVTADEIAYIAPEPLIKSEQGTVFGKNIYTNEPYTINLAAETKARNILIIAPSGSGKTYMLYNLSQNVLEHNSRAVFTDIKGNEYSTLVKSVGGAVLDLSDTSTYFLDCVRRTPREKDNIEYFNKMDNLLHDILCILAGEALTEEVSTLFSNFITSMWVQIGVTADNIDTWKETSTMDIFMVFDLLQQYCYQQADENSQVFIALNYLGKYLLRTSEFAYIWRDPIDLNDIMTRNAISFAFNILTGQSNNKTLFKLRWLFMDIIMTDYIYYNYKHNLRTLNVMEEAQVVDEYVMKMYCRHWTLGRSLMQDNVFIANSFERIQEREDARPILENAMIIVTSSLPPKTRDNFIQQYGLDAFRYMIEDLEKPNNKNSFFIYPMSKSTQPGVFLSLSDGKELTVSKPT